jgi:hypothetical protein
MTQELPRGCGNLSVGTLDQSNGQPYQNGLDRAAQWQSGRQLRLREGASRQPWPIKGTWNIAHVLILHPTIFECTTLCCILEKNCGYMLVE